MIDKDIQNIYYSILARDTNVKQSDNEIDVQCIFSTGGAKTNDIYLLLPGRIAPTLNVSYWGFVDKQPWGLERRLVSGSAYSYWGVGEVR